MSNVGMKELFDENRVIITYAACIQ